MPNAATRTRKADEFVHQLAAAAIGQTARAIPYRPTEPIQNWNCDDTKFELFGAPGRQIPMRPVPSGTDLTWSDYFAGAGGSSSGIHNVPGAHVKLAVNHWPLAIETHNYNHPDTDHDVANVARTEPHRYPKTDCAWFSPECTYWSVARGEKCDYDMDSEQLTIDAEDDDTPESKEARWRSRMLMRDVVRFSRHHKYKAVIVENVPDILKWARFDRWIAEMHAMGYNHKVVNLNSAFANALGAPAPQLRDRVYIVFWQAKYKTPNWRKWLSPKSWCPKCENVVSGLYTAKQGPRRPMRYGPRMQYTYRCPNKPCQGQMVHPFIMPAAAAIDWSIPGNPIGGRKRPLAKKTLQRIQAGLDRYANQPMLTPAGGTWNDSVTPIGAPMRARTTRENEAVVTPPPFLTLLRSGRNRTIDMKDPLATLVADGAGHALIAPLEGRDGKTCRTAMDPFRAQTARHQDGLIQLPRSASESLVVPIRNNGVAATAVGPINTISAGGTHHALVMRNNTARGDQGQMSTPVHEPIRTVTTEGGQSLVQWASHTRDHALYAYDTGEQRPITKPLPTQTGVEGDAVLKRAVKAEDCTIRMLLVPEIQEGMAFDEDYVLLGTAKRDKVRMLGNAVTPCASRDLVACVMEAITGVDIPLFDQF